MGGQGYGRGDGGEVGAEDGVVFCADSGERGGVGMEEVEAVAYCTAGGVVAGEEEHAHVAGYKCSEGFG